MKQDLTDLTYRHVSQLITDATSLNLLLRKYIFTVLFDISEILYTDNSAFRTSMRSK